MVLLALSVAVPSVAGATVVVPITVQDLTRTSDDVVVATVVQGRSQWQGGRIVTDYQLQVAAVMKGALAPGATTVVRLPGGVVGRIGQTVAGVAPLTRGTTYLLFLATGPDGVRCLTHLTAAVMAMGADPVSGDVVGTVPEGLVAVPQGTHMGTVALEAMDRAVRAAQVVP